MRGLSPVAASGGHSSSRCAGLSLSRPLLLRSTGFRRTGSAVVAHGPSRSAACGIFPDQGSNPCALHWQADSQPLRHQGSPVASLLTHGLPSCLVSLKRVRVTPRWCREKPGQDGQPGSRLQRLGTSSPEPPACEGRGGTGLALGQETGKGFRGPASLAREAQSLRSWSPPLASPLAPEVFTLLTKSALSTQTL